MAVFIIVERGEETIAIICKRTCTKLAYLGLKLKKREVKRHVGLARYKLQVDMSDKLYNIIVSKYDGFKVRLNEMSDFEFTFIER